MKRLILQKKQSFEAANFALFLMSLSTILKYGKCSDYFFMTESY